MWFLLIYWVFCFLLNRSQTYTVIRSSTKYTEIIIQNSKTPTNPRKSQKITIHQKQPETTSETTTKPTRNPDTTCFYPNPSDTYAKYGGVGCIWILGLLPNIELGLERLRRSGDALGDSFHRHGANRSPHVAWSGWDNVVCVATHCV